MWKSTFRLNYQPTFSPTVLPFTARISRVVWTWKHLASEVGTSKNHGGGGQRSHNKPIGCGASGAYAPGPDDKEVSQQVICMLLVPVRVGTPLSFRYSFCHRKFVYP
jgi:hypothetical protein